MILYLSRHGEASHPGPGQPSSLTPRGQSDVSRMAEAFVQKKKLKVSAIWHSPKTRAVQTAEIYRKAHANPLPVLEQKETLEPDGDINRIHEELSVWKGGDLLIVSHLPFLPGLTELLLKGRPDASSWSYPTSGLAAIEFGTRCKFLWFLEPSSL